MPQIAAHAAADLRALQERHVQGRRVLHATLIGPTPDTAGWQAVEDGQLELVDSASRRYLQFLVEASASLDAAQKQRFAH